METGRRGGAATGWSHTQAWQLGIRRDILVVEVPQEEQGAPAPHQAPQPVPPGLGRRAPSTAGVKLAGIRPGESQGGCGHRRYPRPPRAGDRGRASWFADRAGPALDKRALRRKSPSPAPVLAPSCSVPVSPSVLLGQRAPHSGLRPQEGQSDSPLRS